MQKMRETIQIPFEQTGYTESEWINLCSDLDRLAKKYKINKARVAADLLRDGAELAIKNMEGEK